MSIDFEQYAQKGKEFLRSLATELGDETNLDHAGRVLRSVFHALRNHFTIEESMDLIAQLPMSLKGIYVEGWRIHKTQTKIKTVEDLCGEVIKEGGNSVWRDYSNPVEISEAVHAVIKILAKYVSTGELNNAFGTLAAPLKDTLMEWTHK